MRVLLVHNYYRQRGGEDRVFEAEAALLEGHGHEVLRYTAHNEQVAGRSAAGLALATLWNRPAAKELAALCERERPAVVHFHNIFPLISPAAYHAVRAAGVPVVQTLHNYRLLCPGSNLFRNGRVCEDCVGRAVPWRSIVHGCYRDRAASAAATAMVSTHRALRSWGIAAEYIAPTRFLREKYVAGGMPATRISVKPHFVPADPGGGAHDGGYALFVGRLSPEKGIGVLLEAWARIGERVPLKVIGEGPLEPLLERPPAGVEWLGPRRHDEVVELMKHAALLVFPSECYESFGLTIIEAFATGLPVVASRAGSPAELVDDGETGVHFAPGDAADLAERVGRAVERPQRLRQMGERARAQYLDRYTGERNYRMLLETYRRVGGV